MKKVLLSAAALFLVAIPRPAGGARIFTRVEQLSIASDSLGWRTDLRQVHSSFSQRPVRRAYNLPGMRLRVLVPILLLSLGCAQNDSRRQATDGVHAVQAFETVMKELAQAWNNGDAERAAACFTADAVYSDPPDRQLFLGRAELYEFFGGAEGRAREMRMDWHHLAFDPESGIGFGEFTFTYGSSSHGVAVVRIRDGKIANWREYWYESDLPWREFIASNPF